MRKSAHGNFDLYLALLGYRKTPKGNWLVPPQRLFSRRTRNLLPPQDMQKKLINSKQTQAYYYILEDKALPEL